MTAFLQLAVLYLAPCAALLLLLWCGRYPGERLIARLARGRARPRRRAVRAIVAAAAAGTSRISGGRLLAHRLAGRGPPHGRDPTIRSITPRSNPMHRKPILGAAIALALAAPAAAHAHVTIQPSQATAGGFTVESVRVPNERDDAATTKVAVQFPPGFASASYEATPGWTVNVQKSKLAQPVKTGDGEITDQVSRITWTADSKADAIQPGQFRDFPLSVKIPDAAGQRLTFKALQTYDNGEIVRWIGTPDSDTPAPQLTVLPAASGDGGGHASAGTAPGAASEPVAATAGEAGGKASKGLAIAALVVGALGLAAGAAALVTRRRA